MLVHSGGGDQHTVTAADEGFCTCVARKKTEVTCVQMLLSATFRTSHAVHVRACLDKDTHTPLLTCKELDVGRLSKVTVRLHEPRLGEELLVHKHFVGVVPHSLQVV